MLFAVSPVTAEPPFALAPLPEIIRSGDLDALQAHLRKDRASANRPLSDTGTYPLHLCAFLDHADMASALLRARADANATNNVGITPLHAAARSGAVRTGSVLVQRRADLNAAARGGLTPLHIAVRQGHETMTERLVEWGADPALPASDSLSALQWAQANHKTNLVDIITTAQKRRKLWQWEVTRNQTMREWHREETRPFDSNNDGNVDVARLGEYRDARAERRNTMQETLAQWLLEQYDLTGDGRIRRFEVQHILDDLQKVAQMPSRGIEYQQALSAVYLRYFDHDEDGWISPIEAAAGRRFLGQARQPYSSTNKVININVRWAR